MCIHLKGCVHSRVCLLSVSSQVCLSREVCLDSQVCYLPEKSLLIGQFILQLVTDVVQRRGLSLSTEVTLLQSHDPLLHVLLLAHGLDTHTPSLS